MDPRQFIAAVRFNRDCQSVQFAERDIPRDDYPELGGTATS